MRTVASVLSAVLVLSSAGCGRAPRAAEPEPTPAPAAPPAPTPPRPPLTFGPGDGRYVDDYRGNFVAADRKWKGRRGTVRVWVCGLGRTKAGELYVSEEGIGGQTHNLYYFMAPGQEDAFAALRKDDHVLVEATCAGREDDGVYRGIVGYEFRVVFRDAVLKGPDPDAPR